MTFGISLQTLFCITKKPSLFFPQILSRWNFQFSLESIRIPKYFNLFDFIGLTPKISSKPTSSMFLFLLIRIVDDVVCHNTQPFIQNTNSVQYIRLVALDYTKWICRWLWPPARSRNPDRWAKSVTDRVPNSIVKARVYLREDILLYLSIDQKYFTSYSSQFYFVFNTNLNFQNVWFVLHPLENGRIKSTCWIQQR